MGVVSMTLSRCTQCIFGLVLLTGLPVISCAGNTAEFDDYLIQYNALSTDTLLPAVARAYKLRRSKNSGMVNIVVQKKTSSGAKGVTAKITGTGINMNQQLKRLKFNEIKDADVIYYIADFRITNKEMLNFKLEVTPAGSDHSYPIEFRQEFYVH